MKKAFVLVAALASVGGALPAAVTSASAETVIIHRPGRDCHMVRDVRFTPHGKIVNVHRVCR